MTRPNLKEILTSHQVAPGLEGRILTAVRAEQTRESIWLKRVHFGIIMGLAASFGASIATVAAAVTHGSTPVVLETLLQNQDVLSLEEMGFALLETLPIGSIALTLTVAALLSLAASVRLPRHTIRHALPFHFFNFV